MWDWSCLMLPTNACPSRLLPFAAPSVWIPDPKTSRLSEASAPQFQMCSVLHIRVPPLAVIHTNSALIAGPIFPVEARDFILSSAIKQTD